MLSISKLTGAGWDSSPHWGLPWGLGSGTSPVSSKTAMEHGCALTASMKARDLSESRAVMIVIGHVYHQKGGLSNTKPHLTVISFHLYLFLGTCCSKKKHSVLFPVNLVPLSWLFLLSPNSITKLGDWMELASPSCQFPSLMGRLNDLSSCSWPSQRRAF